MFEKYMNMGMIITNQYKSLDLIERSWVYDYELCRQKYGGDQCT